MCYICTGISPLANIPTLAIGSRAAAALRGVCEPYQACGLVGFVIPVRAKKEHTIWCALFLVTRTGIEPMFSP